ncbi:neuropeptide SIFamide-like [Leguminivora glycinivorella]|uniref:neuropeptide SIFamide-like n=1 Tax=Leguminivora glycinivorella TaxID=1035111 RepID=UPI00200EADD5|nr:neuropeptide SIFamide-like [Leguminivora glycinivorella]XP_048001879.1 neuropeptide SIFamide-like [Leguminivora glycinivorella]XP_048001880.1 neuropeptide SIFamide-like [Leguminivora glycinivorella]
MHAFITLCFLVVIMCALHFTEGAYKKPPFNGSIFGKRGYVEYDSTGRALSALCEIASETCQAWYQALENN